MTDGMLLQIVTTIAGFIVFGGTLIWKVAAMFSSRDLTLAHHVRERDDAIAKVRSEHAAFRAEVAEKYASKDGLASWMREIKAEMDRRFDKLDEKIDRLTERTQGHDD